MNTAVDEPVGGPGRGQPAAGPRQRGRLYLVPGPLDFGTGTPCDLRDVLPLATLTQAARIDHWICENAKTLRGFLQRVGEVVPLRCGLRDMQVQALPHAVHKKGDHGAQFDARPLLTPALAGHDIGLASEAGMPAVADPGSSVVRAAHDLQLEVVPLVGPVSLLLALAASGLSGQSFAFVGYLPQEATDRAERIRQLESLALKTGQTQMFIETPYRNPVLLQALLQTLQPQTRLAVAVGLTLSGGGTHSDTVKNWRRNPKDLDLGRPAVFAIGR